MGEAKKLVMQAVIVLALLLASFNVLAASVGHLASSISSDQFEL